MRLDDIGFYTLSDNRAKRVSKISPIYRLEIIILENCNFKCIYCRGLNQEYYSKLSFADTKKTIDFCSRYGLINIRFSGGEPTLHRELIKMIEYARENKCEHIAVSTNGSADILYYQDLLGAGVNDFSISLDACCSETAKKMNGGIENVWEKTLQNIQILSRSTYVTVGIVFNNRNIGELSKTIELANDLGVSDIRLISSAQTNISSKKIGDINNYGKPILKYRLKNYVNGRNIRGISRTDCHSCYLVVDDLAIMGRYHFPCIIYMREGGRAIGMLSDNFRKERIEWLNIHDSYKDDICRNQCLDVCVDYNNKARKTNETFGTFRPPY